MEGIYDWIVADARAVPFRNESFEGVYSFGLLHEFTGDGWEENVKFVVDESWRLLNKGGLFVLAVLSGLPNAGLPDVQFFTSEMLVKFVKKFQILHLDEYNDIGCTGRVDYRILFCVLRKKNN